MELYTIIAQIINFSVLLFLLNKFLYKPVMKTMEKRRNDIKQKIDDTEKKLEETEKLKEEYLNKLKEVEEENIVLRQRVIDDVAKFKEIEMQKAQDDISNKRERFNDYLKLEQKNLLEKFNKNLLDMFVKYSNHMFSAIANSTLQKEIINAFLNKVNILDKDKIEDINKMKADKIYIISNALLADDEKELIKKSLKDKGFIFSEIEFMIDKKLVLGIDMKIGSYVFSWNIKEFTEHFISTIDKINDKN